MNSKKVIMNFIQTKSLLPFLILSVIPFCLPLGLVFLLCWTLPFSLRARKTVKALEASGQLEQAARELLSPDAKKYINGKLILSEHFIFCKGTGFIFSYQDILWAYHYRIKQRVFFIPIMVRESLFLATRTMKPRGVCVMGKDRLDDIDHAILEIYAHNPRCLVGFTPEIQKTYRAAIKS